MPRPGSVYSPHPSFAMEESSLANLRERTGLGLSEWIDRLRQQGPLDDKAARAWLKAQHPAITTNYQHWIVERAQGKGSAEHYDPDAMVEAMFAKKEGLFPIYEQSLRFVFSLGSDVKVSPCQTIIPVFRNHVFAQFKPSTRTRLDLGLCLRGVDQIPPRPIATGGLEKKDRITHRFALTSLADLDAEVAHWLHKAYELDR
jgi:hypothetical protein